MALLIGDLLVKLSYSQDQDLGAKFADLEAQIGKTGASFQSLQVQLAETKTKSQDAAGGIDLMGVSLDKLATRLALRFAIFEFVKILGEVGDAFDQAQEKIQGFTGAVGDNLQAFNSSLSTVLANATQTAEQVGTVMGQLSSSLNLKPSAGLEKLSTDLLQIGKITGESVAQISEKTAELINAFKIDPSEAEGFLTRLLTVAQDTGIKFSVLEADLRKFKGVFDDLGVGTDNAIQFLGRLQQSGLNVSQVMTSLQEAMRKLAAAGATDLYDALGALISKIQNATTTTEALSLASKAFPRDSAEMVDAIRSGTLSMDAMKASLDPLNASIGEQANSVVTLKESWQQFLNTLSSGSAGSAAGGVIGTLKDGLSALGPILNGIAAVFEVFAGPGDAELEKWGYTATLAEPFEHLGEAMSKAKETLDDLRSGLLGFIDTLLAPVPLPDWLRGLASATNFNLIGAVAGGSLSPSDLAKAAAGRENWATPGGESEVDPWKVPGAYAGAQSGPAKTFLASSLAAVANLGKKTGGAKLPQDAEYQLLQREVKLLEDQLGAKDKDVLAYEKSVLQGLIGTGDQLPRTVLEGQAKQKFDQKYGIPETMDFIQTLSDAQASLINRGLDYSSSLKMLGLPDPQQLDNAIVNIQDAFAKIRTSGEQTPAFIDLAWSKELDAIIAKMRAAGASVPSWLIVNQDVARTDTQISGMDFGLARQALGVTTEAQGAQANSVTEASLRTLLSGPTTGVDQINAMIAALQQEASVAAKTGQAFDDYKQSALNALLAIRSANTLNTEGAYQFFGISSKADFDDAMLKIQKAYDLIQADPTASQADIAIAEMKKLQDQLDATRKAGGTVGDDLVVSLSAAQAKIVLLTNDLQKAMSGLGVLDTSSATQQMTQLEDSYKRIVQAFGEGSTAADEALKSKLTADIQLLQKSGQAVGDSLVQQLDDITAKIQARTLTIDQAYQTLGIQSISQLNAQLTVASAALQKIEADVNATDFQKFQAGANYLAEVYQNAIKSGQSFDQLGKALNDIDLDRIKIKLQDLNNPFVILKGVIADVYNSISNDLSNAITGLITDTTSVGDAFKKMGLDIVNVLVNDVIKNVLLTKSNLADLQSAILGLFGHGAGAASSAGGAILDASGEAVSAGTQAAGAAASGAGSAGSSISGLLSGGGLGTIFSGISAVTGVLSGIVSGIQQEHANNLLDEIEKSTRFTWIATGEASDSVSRTNITIAQKTAAMLDFMNGDLRTYLQNINVDLDMIAGHPLTAAVSGGGNDAIVNVLTQTYNLIADVGSTLSQELADVINALQSRAATSTATAGVSKDVANRLSNVADAANAAAQTAVAAVGTTFGHLGSDIDPLTGLIIPSTTPLNPNVSTLGNVPGSQATQTQTGAQIAAATTYSSGSQQFTNYSAQSANNGTFNYGAPPPGVINYQSIDWSQVGPQDPAVISLLTELVRRPDPASGPLANALNNIQDQVFGGAGLNDVLGTAFTRLNASLDSIAAGAGADYAGLTGRGLNISEADYNQIFLAKLQSFLQSDLPTKAGVIQTEQLSDLQAQVAQAQSDFSAWLQDFLSQQRSSGGQNLEGSSLFTGDPRLDRTSSTTASYLGGVAAQVAQAAPAVQSAADNAAHVGILSVQVLTNAQQAAIALQNASAALAAAAPTMGAAAASIAKVPALQQITADMIRAVNNPATPYGVAIGSGVVDPTLLADSRRPGGVVININGSQFPTGMSPQQVAEALSQQVQNVMGQLR